MNDITLINDAIKKHRELSEYYDAMGCKDDVLVQERYIGWLSELREYKEKQKTIGDEIAEMIDEAPTIDAEPVRHGRWNGVGKVFSEDWACSNCGHTKGKGSGRNFCGNCGAKMDGDTDDET